VAVPDVMPGVPGAQPGVVQPGVVQPGVAVPGVVQPGMAVPDMMPGVPGLQPGWLVNVAPQYQYYYGPTYAYDYDWYLQRHLTYPWLYEAYDSDPGVVCATYYYAYQGRYYCYIGD
jgi:hypothetical protein